MKHRDTMLKLAALLLIAFMAGPEIGVAIELTALLEIVGALMFLMSFSAGARILLTDLGRVIRDFVCPTVIYAVSPAHAAAGAVAARTLWRVSAGFIAGWYLLAIGSGRLN